MRITTQSEFMGKAAEDPASASRQRIAEAVRELLALHLLFLSTQRQERPPLYAQCIPWLREVKAHTKPPLPVREMTALTEEVDGHLRSLAALGMGNSSKDEEHIAWALGGLKTLARCVGPC